MSSAPVLLTLDERGVATVTFNRPEVNNAYNGEFISTLLAGLDHLYSVEGLRVVVVRGAGRHFQAGADLAWINSVRPGTSADNEAASKATFEAVQRLNELPVPTLALVQGACFGGGTGVLAACDVVLAANDALFSISEVRWGLTPAIIIPQLVDAIGLRQVRRYALSGERFDAVQACRIGLVHEVVPREELESAGARMVEQLLLNGPDALAVTKQAALESAWGGQPATAARWQPLIVTHANKRQSTEAAEGLASFLEKRPASWVVPQP